jgi:hypothetical protein
MSTTPNNTASSTAAGPSSSTSPIINTGRRMTTRSRTRNSTTTSTTTAAPSLSTSTPSMPTTPNTTTTTTADSSTSTVTYTLCTPTATTTVENDDGSGEGEAPSSPESQRAEFPFNPVHHDLSADFRLTAYALTTSRSTEKDADAGDSSGKRTETLSKFVIGLSEQEGDLQDISTCKESSVGLIPIRTLGPDRVNCPVQSTVDVSLMDVHMIAFHYRNRHGGVYH